MPGPYRVTYLFNGIVGSGFSESWYYNLMDVITPGDITKMTTFGQRRSQCTAIGWQLKAFRVHDMDTKRVVRLVEQNMLPKAQDAETGPDVPAAAWLYRATTTAGSKRQMWLRGGDDSWIKWNPGAQAFLVDPTLEGRINTFKSSLIGSNQNPSLWRLRTIKPVGAAGTQTKTVAVLALNAINNPVLTLSDNVGLAGFTLIVSGFKSPWAYLNGTYTAAQYVLVGNNLTLNKAADASLPLINLASLRVRLQAIDYAAISNLDFVRPGTRRVGRQFFAPAGRRRARA